MAGIGGVHPDELGVSTLGDFDAPRYDQLDEIDADVGSRLSRLEGRRLVSVFVVFDGKWEGADAWDFDSPVILRFDDVDVAVESVSGMVMSIAFGEAPTGGPLRMFPPDGGANDEMNSWLDLSWREYAPVGDAFGRAVERVYWRADDYCHPLAVGVRLDGGLHLRVGDGGDNTIPELVDPLAVDEATEFDEVILPVGYNKPVSSAPVIASTDWLLIPNREQGVRFLALEGGPAGLHGSPKAQFREPPLRWWPRVGVCHPYLPALPRGAGRYRHLQGAGRTARWLPRRQAYPDCLGQERCWIESACYPLPA